MRLIDADAVKKDIARLHILNDEAEIRRAYASNPYSTLSDFEDTLVSVFDAIDDTPTIDAVSEWIPCSERLPRKDGTYLVTYEWIGKTGNKYIEIEGIDFEHGRWDCHDYEKVTAWMPLPKPWKGVDDERSEP